MAKTIAIGIQDFAELRMQDLFYIDKTSFIKDWWQSGDVVTLITRPRRFGKTLNLSMVNTFFSTEYAGRGEELFEGLDVWNDESMRSHQGTWPVVFMSFAGIKYKDFDSTRKAINSLIAQIYADLKKNVGYDKLSYTIKGKFDRVSEDMDDVDAAMSINNLCGMLENRYGKKCIVILDEYDTPMQEAWVGGFWDEMVSYTRALFNNTFKTNSHLSRGLMTGITRVSKESIFSDLNNLNVITTTSNEYAASFGFTEEEVFKAMTSQGIDTSMQKGVKEWYDGFTFGNVSDIYNPWSITNYLKKGEFKTYWADTSGNGLVEKLLRTGNGKTKGMFEDLLKGDSIDVPIDEEVIFSQIADDEDSIWSLLVASGYLKVCKITSVAPDRYHKEPVYTLTLTNLETHLMFEKMVKRWFSTGDSLSPFVKAMLKGDIREMNSYMNRIALNTFSSFDTGTHASATEPERFYHGFVLGLMVEKASDYMIKSNRESGFGRYDVIMEPIDIKNAAVIMEFKVIDREYEGEKDLNDTAANALKQINDKRYDTDLIARGIPTERILKYGFAFEGSKCLIVK